MNNSYDCFICLLAGFIFIVDCVPFNLSSSSDTIMSVFVLLKMILLFLTSHEM